MLNNVSIISLTELQCPHFLLASGYFSSPSRMMGSVRCKKRNPFVS